MPALDFKEIAASTAGARRDQFELFAREFLECIGFKVVVGPDRGPDGGRDLVVEEARTGVVGETRFRWLVSCKHKAHSGGSVTPNDEQDIHDRVRTHNCDGFMGFYSTIPSSGLATKLNAKGLPFEVQVYDPEGIERRLLTPSGLGLAKRFFPVSFAEWQREHPSPAKIFRDKPILTCLYCKKNLLKPKPRGIIVVWTSVPTDDQSEKKHTEHVYWCCKGLCDKALKAKFRQKGLIDGWEDIPDLIIPLVYIRWLMAMLNEFKGGMTYSDDALKNSKTFLLNLFPLVSRHMTAGEKERIKTLQMIPHYLGGLGY